MKGVFPVVALLCVLAMITAQAANAQSDITITTDHMVYGIGDIVTVNFTLPYLVRPIIDHDGNWEPAMVYVTLYFANQDGSVGTETLSGWYDQSTHTERML